MVGVTRKLAQPAICALGCGAIAVLGMMAATQSGMHVLAADAALAALLTLGACIALLNRKAKGLPVFTEEVVVKSPPDLEAHAVHADDLASSLLRDPPADAQVTRHNDRQVIVLADGSVIGELLTGGARRFPSLGEFRSFVGG
jgi:hypothetical protein